MIDIRNIARDVAVDAIRDQAHDLMGCSEVLEDHAAEPDGTVPDHLVNALSDELYAIAEDLETGWRLDAILR